MSTPEHVALEQLQVADQELWTEGPPHEVFRRLRSECPVHWSAGVAQAPEEAGSGR